MKFVLLSFFITLSFIPVAIADSDDVLGAFPVVGSLEEKEDIDQLLFYQKNRTSKQCEAAQAEANNAGLESFFGGKHGLLNLSEILIINKKLRKLKLKTGVKILYYKTKFSRKRPYVVHQEIKPCIDLEKSKSYPSGHTTLARMYARVLSVIFPERAFLFLKRAEEVGLNRVIGGVHHPSDIVAGMKLGDSIADDFLEEGDSYYQLKTLIN